MNPLVYLNSHIRERERERGRDHCLEQLLYTWGRDVQGSRFESQYEQIKKLKEKHYLSKTIHTYIVTYMHIYIYANTHPSIHIHLSMFLQLGSGMWKILVSSLNRDIKKIERKMLPIKISFNHTCILHTYIHIYIYIQTCIHKHILVLLSSFHVSLAP